VHQKRKELAMLRKITIALVGLVVIIAVGGGVYLSWKQQKYTIEIKGGYPQESEVEVVKKAIQNTLSDVSENKISLPEENNGIRYVVKTFYLTKEVNSTVRIVVYQYSDQHYLWKEDYEGEEGWGSRNFKEEVAAFRGLSFGFHEGGPSPAYAGPNWVKKLGELKFIIVDGFFPPAGSFTRIFASYVNWYLIEIYYICTEGADLVDHEDRSKGVVFNQQNQKIINEIEDALRDFKHKQIRD
jgi:hypothetical protein